MHLLPTAYQTQTYTSLYNYTQRHTCTHTHTHSNSVMRVCPNRSCMMQADSEKLRQAWIKAVQNSIATAFRDKGDEGEVKTKHGKIHILG